MKVLFALSFVSQKSSSVNRKQLCSSICSFRDTYPGKESKNGHPVQGAAFSMVLWGTEKTVIDRKKVAYVF